MNPAPAPNTLPTDAGDMALLAQLADTALDYVARGARPHAAPRSAGLHEAGCAPLRRVQVAPTVRRTRRSASAGVARMRR
jgi:hypothetical protein